MRPETRKFSLQNKPWSPSSVGGTPPIKGSQFEHLLRNNYGLFSHLNIGEMWPYLIEYNVVDNQQQVRHTKPKFAISPLYAGTPSITIYDLHLFRYISICATYIFFKHIR